MPAPIQLTANLPTPGDRDLEARESAGLTFSDVMETVAGKNSGGSSAKAEGTIGKTVLSADRKCGSKTKPAEAARKQSIGQDEALAPQSSGTSVQSLSLPILLNVPAPTITAVNSVEAEESGAEAPNAPNVTMGSEALESRLRAAWESGAVRNAPPTNAVAEPVAGGSEQSSAFDAALGGTSAISAEVQTEVSADSSEIDQSPGLDVNKPKLKISALHAPTTTPNSEQAPTVARDVVASKEAAELANKEPLYSATSTLTSETLVAEQTESAKRELSIPGADQTASGRKGEARQLRPRSLSESSSNDGEGSRTEASVSSRAREQYSLDHSRTKGEKTHSDLTVAVAPEAIPREKRLAAASNGSAPYATAVQQLATSDISPTPTASELGQSGIPELGGYGAVDQLHEPGLARKTQSGTHESKLEKIDSPNLADVSGIASSAQLRGQQPQPATTAASVHETGVAAPSIPVATVHQPATADAGSVSSAIRNTVTRNDAPAEVRAFTHVESARLVERATSAEMQVRLQTPELGRVEVHASAHDDRIGTTLSAERPEIQRLFASELPSLSRELERQQVQFSLQNSASPGSGGKGAQEQGQQSRWWPQPEAIPRSYDPLRSPNAATRTSCASVGSTYGVDILA